MGATNQIKGTNLSLKIIGLACAKCLKAFTKPEIEKSNWEVWWDTTHDVELEPLSQGYQFSIWIRSIEHQNCPEISKDYE